MVEVGIFRSYLILGIWVILKICLGFWEKDIKVVGLLFIYFFFLGKKIELGDLV